VLLIGCSARGPDLPRLGTLPGYRLTDQAGRPWGSADLAGRPYVTSFFFTSCATICPKIMGAMHSVDRQVTARGGRVRMVSITVDPVTDDPAQLGSYGEKLGIDPGRWALLTGSPDELRRVIVDGFKTTMGDREAVGGDLFDIGHGARLVLVDAEGQVRGHFETDPTSLDTLVRAYLQLARED
jgi:protein SCO1/2